MIKKVKFLYAFFGAIVIFGLIWNTQIYAQTSYTVSSVPNPRLKDGGFISDPDHFLKPTDYKELNLSLIKLESETTTEFAIVILGSIGDGIPKEFAVELFNKWGIGKKTKDNGLLLLLVMDQRRWEFETGYGLEGVLPDVILKRIGETQLVPKLKQKKMEEGFSDVIQSVTAKIKNEPDTNIVTSDSISDQTELSPNDPFMNSKIFSYSFFLFSEFMAPFYAILLFLGIHYLKDRKGKKSSLLFSEFLVNWKIISIGVIPYILYFLFLKITSGYFFITPAFFSTYTFLGSYIFISISVFLWESSSKKYRDPYEYYKVIDAKIRSWEFITVFILFLPFIVFILIWSLIKKRSLRLQSRFCSHCNTEMIRLDEDKDDFFLKDGQKIEEKIGSVDYDVWYCDASKDVKIYAYEAFFTSYSKCPSCKFKTYFVESDVVTVSPTCTSSGSGIRKYACKNCSYKTSNTYSIPARDCSKSSSSGSSYSSSSSSYGSSSSSSSFGGGRSGGGGAGGSW